MRLLLVFLFGVVLAPAAHAQGLGRGTAEAPVTECPTADSGTMGMDRTRLRVDEYYNTVTFGSAEAKDRRVETLKLLRKIVEGAPERE